MRRGKSCAILAMLAAAGCASPEPLQDMVGYVPPTSLPAQPKRTLVADPPDVVWDNLVAFLEGSPFEVDHLDRANNLLVARYSGDPEPYVDCGSIVTHEAGALGQIAGSAQAVALNYEIDEQPVVLNRSLSLDSRIIVRLDAQPSGEGTVISTDTTYVVTKTVDVEDSSGGLKEGSREAVSFSAGKRAAFSKGTACQPNGSLDLALLQSLPNVIGSDEIARADLVDPTAPSLEGKAATDDAPATAVDRPTPPKTDEAGDASVEGDGVAVAEAPTPVAVPTPPLEDDADWLLPEQGLPRAALPQSDLSPDKESEAGGSIATPAAPVPPEPTTPTPVETAGVADNDAGSAIGGSAIGGSSAIVEETTRKLLESLDCGGAEWHFCELVKLTAPYRQRNIEKLYGLTINTTESFTSQIAGEALKLDLIFPNFPAYLHVAYALRDGTVEHVMSSSELWPAGLAHRYEEGGHTIPGPPGLAMIVAIASDEPLFASPPPAVEDAATYLGRLRQRLAELESGGSSGQIAASQLLIYVENAKS
jgi:hypothetical protein